MKELKTPVSFLLYTVGAYIAHIIIMDLISFVESVVYAAQV